MIRKQKAGVWGRSPKKNSYHFTSPIGLLYYVRKVLQALASSP
jgi:hypothetical protein